MRAATAKSDTRFARIVVCDGSNLYAKQPFLTEADRGPVRKEKARIAIRHAESDKWDGKADNDNALNWPLARALVREGNTDLLKVAISYRRIYDQAKSEAVLGGSSPVIGDGISLDQYVKTHESGAVEYKGARKSKAAPVDIPATRKIPAGGLSSTNVSNVPKPWTGDRAVNEMIDAKALLERLQARLGHLCEPTELAVIDGSTLEAVGNSIGVANRTGAQAAGRALVHTGLITLRDALKR
jgi:hypothetical protein